MNIIEKLIEEQIASNPFQAAHIANGLRLADCKTDEERITRAKLYRDWRNAGESSKVAYQKAIAGEEPMKLPKLQGEMAEATMDDIINGDWQI